MREQIDNAIASETLEAIDIEVNDPVDEENYEATYSNGTDKNWFNALIISSELTLDCDCEQQIRSDYFACIPVEFRDVS